MRQFFMISLKILVSGTLMFFALRKVDFHVLVSRLDRDSIGWIASAIAIALAQIVLNAVRWQKVSTECGAPLTAGQALRFNFIGSFFNQTLPSSIGGDAVRIWLVQRAKPGWRKATYSVFVDRAMGLISLAIIVVATLPWSFALISDAQGRTALLMIDMAALGGSAVFLVLGRLPWPGLKTRWQTKDLFACSVIANRLLFSPRSGSMIAILSLIIHVLTATIAWCVVRSIEAPVAFSQVFELVLPVILVTMVPISIAGWGVREASMGLAFGYAGLATGEGVNVSLLFGTVTFVVGALGGLA